MGHKPFVMFDIAYYLNDMTLLEIPQDLNCAPHYDPGLISLSILSTTPGLELQDANGNWISGPQGNDIGVLWLGEAARKASFYVSPLTPAIHRVVYPKDLKPRLTMWYEICTSSQVLQETPKDNFPQMTFNVPNPMANNYNFILTNAPGAQTVQAPTKLQALRKIEITKGIPMSKSMVHHFSHNS